MDKIKQVVQTHRDRAGMYVLLAIAVLALGLIWYAAGSGLTIKSDSVRYIMGAENLAAGNGYVRYSGSGSVKPIAVFPPGYPLLLSVFAAAGLEILTAARILNLVFFPLSVLLTGWLVYKLSGKWIPAILGSLMVMGYAQSVRYHSMVMSESALIFFSLVTVSMLFLFLEKRKIWMLITAGLLLGYTPLVRYLGAALLPAAVLVVFLFYQASWRKRIGAAAYTMIMGVLPLALWFFRNSGQTGSAMNRSLAFHPPPLDKIAGYVDEVIGWFIPAVLGSDWRPRLSHLAVFLLAASSAFLYLQYRKLRKTAHDENSRFPYSLLPLFSFVYLVCYAGVLFVSITFLDASLGGYQRYLIPTFFFVVFILAELVNFLLERKGAWKTSGWIVVILWAAVVGMHFKGTRDNLWSIRNNRGLGVDMELLQEASQFLNEMDPDILITNDIDLVFLMLDRYAFMIPIRINDYTKEETSDYTQQMQVYSDKMKEGAVLVLFDKIHVQENYATYEELTMGLERIHSSLNVEVFVQPDP